MGDVVNIPRRLYVCLCGCSTFELYENGNVECAACGVASYEEGSGWKPLNDEVAAKADEQHFKDIQGNGSVEFAKRRVASMSKDDDTALIIIAKDHGGVSTWASAETPEQYDWVASRVAHAAALLNLNKIKLEDK